jgi:dipeptidyl aminopeptidase/acylaminoacyl peptidase
VRTEPGSYGGALGTDLAGDGSLAVARFSTTRRAPELWRLGPELRRLHPVSRLNPGFDPSILGGDRVVRWRTGDGEELAGTVLLPPGHRPGTRVPLVVQVYGGDSGVTALHRFDRHRQLLASNGYAVLVPDVPLRVGRPMADHARAVLPGVERLIDLGIADPERIGVTGHSYGGYGTLALLVRSDRFAAAVASAAQGDLVANYGRMAEDGSARTRWSERGQGRMGAPLWEVPERYRDNSPVLFLDRVTAPLLLLHGSEDPTVPIWLAEEIFVGLRRLDRPVALARYEGEGHWSGDWSVANQMDYWRRLLGWFDRHMGPGPGR